jgi:hypothetical protein
MLRFLLPVVLALSFPSLLPASIVHKPGIRPTPVLVRLDDPVLKEGEKLFFNEETEFKLDGKVCTYEDIPKDAVIIAIDFDPVTKHINKIHFRSK